MKEVAEITEEEIRSFTQSIFTRYGIDFTCYEPKSLQRRIVRILTMFEFNSVYELWARMLKDPDFIHRFMDEVSVGMTSMFRDPVLWQHLKPLIGKEYVNRERIDIWHAGCSSGEEVYTMGILLKETALSSKARALATDINRGAIEIARQGIYHKIRMAENENNYKKYCACDNFSKYYYSVADTHNAIMNPDLVRHVSFRYHNLITDIVAGTYDIIFCRNVMIYLDSIAKAKLLEKFYNALNPGGYFVIGFYDTMLSHIDQQKLALADPEAKIFRKI